MTIRIASTFAALALCACSAQSAQVGDGYQKELETFDGPITSLDVLFVVDDSPSMGGHQLDLVAAARDQLFAQLEAQPGGMPDLHVAITSSSVTIDADGATTECSPIARLADGRFVIGNQVVNGTPSDCMIAGTFLSDVSDGAGGRMTNFPGTIEDAFACAAVLGDRGCGLEQPLEAMHRALDGEHSENAGFLRDDAMLLVVFLTDEDDASVSDPTVYDVDSEQAAAFHENDLGFEYGVVCDPDDDSVGPRGDCVPREDSAYFHHIADYTSFLQGLKADPSMIMVAGIAPPATPVMVSPIPQTVPPQLQVDPVCTPPPGPCVDDPTMICTYFDALPAIRLNAFLDAFPARYTLASLCDGPMGARVRQIASTVTGVMDNSTCLVGDVVVTTDRCRALDLAPDGGRAAMGVDIVEDDAMCGYTATHLRAELAPVASGHRVEVDCLR